MYRPTLPTFASLVLAAAACLPAAPALAREPVDARGAALEMLLPEPPAPTLVGPWDEEARAQTLQVDDEPTSADGAQNVWHRLPDEE